MHLSCCQFGRARAQSREHQKMQFFLCYSALFFKLNTFICYNINVLYCYIFEIQLYNKTKKIEFSLSQPFLGIIFTRTHILQPGHQNINIASSIYKDNFWHTLVLTFLLPMYNQSSKTEILQVVYKKVIFGTP